MNVVNLLEMSIYIWHCILYLVLYLKFLIFVFLFLQILHLNVKVKQLGTRNCLQAITTCRNGLSIYFYLLKAHFAIRWIVTYVSEIIHETRQGYTSRQRMSNQLSGRSWQRILLLRRWFLQRWFLFNIKCKIGHGTNYFLLVERCP